jgi:SNF2 family DNA or RNA helicase
LDILEIIIDYFYQERSEKIIFFLSTKDRGLGIKFSMEDVAILYGSDWNPQVHLQGQDCTHRI